MNAVSNTASDNPNAASIQSAPLSRTRKSPIDRYHTRINRREHDWRNMLNEELTFPNNGRLPIPSAIRSSKEASTPLPTLPMIVLSIVMLGEFLSANVSTPFLLFMVEGFGGFRDEADVGYWTGILVACFFLTQFLTSLLWATIAEKHGARTVLFISLLGSSLTCMAFGTSTTLAQAISIRLLQGSFAGAIGVARGNIATITDPNNEGRAYAILGFCWGFGGVAGAIIGGTFESPAKKWPEKFTNSNLFFRYPYLLPTLIAGSITSIGAFLAIFLARDGGPREGAIRLPLEKNVANASAQDETAQISEDDSAPVNSISTRLLKALSGFFRRNTTETIPFPSSTARAAHGRHLAVPIELRNSNSSSSSTSVPAQYSSIDGSAYGYGRRSRTSMKKQANNAAQLFGGRRGNLASIIARRRHGNRAAGLEDAGTTANVDKELNLTQRLLMANEFSVTNIADFWVAAALNFDAKSPPLDDDPENVNRNGLTELMQINEDEFLASPQIFQHMGVRSKFSREHSPSRTAPTEIRDIEDRHDSTADLAHADTRPAAVSIHQREFSDEPLSGADNEQPSSLAGLPLMIIIQYGLLALHSTTHDQVFLSYLVSKYENGGLSLNAGHFAQLIALMSLASMLYQFYLYPNLGPPRGKFSHLSMFRIGSLLFIPAYLSVVLYRPLAREQGDGNLILMIALALSTMLRFAGSTFSYTAVAILLNYVSPPRMLGYANGTAQSAVSLARFAGPVLGGYLWSISIDENPLGYPFGFFICAGVTAVAIASSLFIR